MDADAIDKVLELAPPNIHKVGDLEYTDQSLTLITPPLPSAIKCSNLQSIADLWKAVTHDAPESMIQIVSPTEVSFKSIESDEYGRRTVYAIAEYSGERAFAFGKWYAPENFIIDAQTSFQRVKVQNDDGSFAADLDYVIGIASKITAERAVENSDDGIAQRVALKQGVTLQGEAALKGRVNLAPFRTFLEVDQVLSQFLFRAKYTDNGVVLALFEADGGRWKLDATKAIANWFQTNIGGVTIIS